MARCFREHLHRWTLSLDGPWDFAFLGDTEFDQIKVNELVFDDRISIPGNYDATPRYAGVRGIAAYRRKVKVTDQSLHRLWIDGLHHAGQVYIDGQLVREHLGGFTRFAIDFKPVSESVEIIILADNRIDYERCPLHLSYFDWYHFGGISRSVELQRLGQHYIDHCTFKTLDYEKGQFQINLDLACDDAAGKPLRIKFDDQLLLEESVTFDAVTTKLSYIFEQPGAELWSPDAPHLHWLTIEFGEDDVIDRVGLRQVEARDRDICINGQPQRLLGFNRHEAHPQFGCGLPDALIASDVQQLKEMGCNFVRGSHYPQDIRFLDACDEAGLCVWNETIGWQHTAEHLNDPKFIACQMLQAEEMVANSINRPSVIMWGLLNESHSHDEKSRPGYEQLVGHLRSLDDSRPVTYACNHPFDDLCLDLCDIVSINTYPGWYGGGIETIPQALDDIVAHLDSNGFADRPMIISEIGAGAIYGWRDQHEDRWTEQYQSALLHQVISHMFMDRNRFAGLAIWLFGDARTEQEKAIGRPRMFNNKGVVDEYRRPKQAYATVRDLFTKLNES